MITALSLIFFHGIHAKGILFGLGIQFTLSFAHKMLMHGDL